MIHLILKPWQRRTTGQQSVVAFIHTYICTYLYTFSHKILFGEEIDRFFCFGDNYIFYILHNIYVQRCSYQPARRTNSQQPTRFTRQQTGGGEDFTRSHDIYGAQTAAVRQLKRIAWSRWILGWERGQESQGADETNTFQFPCSTRYINTEAETAVCMQISPSLESIVTAVGRERGTDHRNGLGSSLCIDRSHSVQRCSSRVHSQRGGPFAKPSAPPSA